MSVLISLLCLTLCDPMDYSSPLPVGCSRQECRSGLPFRPPGDLPRPRDRTRVSSISGGFFNHLSHEGSPNVYFCQVWIFLLAYEYLFWCWISLKVSIETALGRGLLSLSKTAVLKERCPSWVPADTVSPSDTRGVIQCG